MEMEFLKQQHEGMLTTGDEIVLWDCDEDMMNGPHQVAKIDEEGSVTLIGLRQNEGTISVIFVGE